MHILLFITPWTEVHVYLKQKLFELNTMPHQRAANVIELRAEGLTYIEPSGKRSAALGYSVLLL